MKLEEIQQHWEKDSKFDQSELGVESLRTPDLHNKYFKMLLTEGQALRAFETKYKELYRYKWEYYLGLLDKDTLEQKEWQPIALKILRADVGIYLDSDKDLQAAKEQFEFQKGKFKLLEDIIKAVHNRGFSIKNAIDWEKFKNGQ